MLLKMTLNSLVFAVVLGLLLFLPAGTLGWPQAWVFMALLIGCSEATGVWLMEADPDLLAARSKSPISADQKPIDRAVMAAIMVVFLGWIVFMGLDARRFGWSHTPAWAQVFGAALIVGAFWGWIGVLRVNTFAATTIKLQQDRGQTVIAAGPYAVVRHPMYAYVLPLMIGTSLLLGSLWGLAWLVPAMPLLAARALGEEAMLKDGLPGYRDYAARVRFRLVPGLW